MYSFNVSHRTNFVVDKNVPYSVDRKKLTVKINMYNIIYVNPQVYNNSHNLTSNGMFRHSLSFLALIISQKIV